MALVHDGTMTSGGFWSGALLILVGVWLVMQVVVGDLPGRLLSYAGVGGR